MDEGVRQEQQAEQARDAWAEVESLREQLEAKAERLTTTQELYLAEQARAEAAEAKLAVTTDQRNHWSVRVEQLRAKLAEVDKERDRLQEQLNAALDVGDRATDQRDRLRASIERVAEAIRGALADTWTIARETTEAPTEAELDAAARAALSAYLEPTTKGDT